ncbi:hypothetical protein SEA_NUEVOMUNDO_217 [Mycobacterium phage NuevoMundo]|nr:hypothetical protein SEA_NUEVOMUNDO_217 [Mycobacterium phage NuevoMundo]AVJ48692.1 hypothetical protein SEA_PIER_215 [Mycobacterium phage Pier]
MGKEGRKSIFRSLAERDLLIPYFRNALLSQEWPDEYTIKVDSSPYYGKGDGYFHPSTHALMPARQLYYHFHPDTRDKIIQEDRTITQEMTLTMGSAIHAVVQTQFQMAGLIKGPDDCEVEYVDRTHHVRGRVDFIVHHPNGQVIPVEMKTQNSRSFDFQDSIKPIWDAQLSLGLHGTGHPLGILLVVESGYPFRMREYRVPRNDQLLTQIFQKFDYVRECIALNKVPEYCCMPQSKEMDACPARYQCWLKDKMEAS